MLARLEKTTTAVGEAGVPRHNSGTSKIPPDITALWYRELKGRAWNGLQYAKSQNCFFLFVKIVIVSSLEHQHIFPKEKLHYVIWDSIF